ncbi:hypothetical protein [Streptomyces sp. NPDC050287]
MSPLKPPVARRVAIVAGARVPDAPLGVNDDLRVTAILERD